MGGEWKRDADFDRRIKFQFHGAKLSSEVGLLLLRELGAALGLTEMAGWGPRHQRTGRNTQHSLHALFRQSVFGRLAGHENMNDVKRLSHDPVMRGVVGPGDVNRGAASVSELDRFETGTLSEEWNLEASSALNCAWIDRVRGRRRSPTLTVNIDSSDSPVHGDQEGAAYSGYFSCVRYRPLLVLNQDGDLERCTLRSGNVASADGCREVLEPVIEQYCWRPLWRRYFRADAMFAHVDIYDFLEQGRLGFAIRLPANAFLGNRIRCLLKRRPGRPSATIGRHLANSGYRADSRDTKRHVVLVLTRETDPD